MTQQARNLSFTGLFERVRLLIHDRESKVRGGLRRGLPQRRHQGDPYADPRTAGERLRLEWLLIVGRRHLETVLRVYTHYYNRERPQRGLALLSPDPKSPDRLTNGGEIKRRDRLGGLIHEYHRAAA